MFLFLQFRLVALAFSQALTRALQVTTLGLLKVNKEAASNPHAVDGKNPANQLRLVVYPIIYKVLYIPVLGPQITFSSGMTIKTYSLIKPATPLIKWHTSKCSNMAYVGYPYQYGPLYQLKNMYTLKYFEYVQHHML